MAGGGIGKCVVCGRDNQPIVNDICQDCTMDEFWAVLASGKDSIAAIASDHEKYREAARFNGTGIKDIVSGKNRND